MVKCFFFVYRAPHLSHEEFADYWQNNHSVLARKNASVMRMKRYVQNHRAQPEVAELMRESRGCLMGDFDGIAEASWDSFEDMLAGAADTPEDVGKAILEDEAKFVDLKRSIIWFADEKPFV